MNLLIEFPEAAMIIPSPGNAAWNASPVAVKVMLQSEIVRPFIGNDIDDTPFDNRMIFSVSLFRQQILQAELRNFADFK